MDAHEVYACIRSNNFSKFKTLVNKGNVGKQVTLNDNTQSILHIACRAKYNLKDNPAFVEYLINECDANTDAWDGFYLTPLHQAVFDSYNSKTNRACVLALLKLKANVNSRFCFNQDNFSQLPLERLLSSMSLHRMEMMWALIEYGATVSSAFDEYYQMRYGYGRTLRQMMNGRTFARRAALTLVGIRRCRRSQVLSLQDSNISIIIAKFVWESRKNFGDWARK